jgi:hypothetical protein
MIGLRRGALGSLLILAVTVSVRGQEAPGPPPAAGTAAAEGSDPLELLPDLGKIGAEVGALAGRSWNPYGTGGGYVLAGFIDLPLLRVAGGKLSYEILLGVSAATSDPLTITDRQVRNRLRLLDASPFGLKYTITHLGSGRVRPYLDAGVDAVVVLSEQLPEGDASAALAAGQAHGPGLAHGPGQHRDRLPCGWRPRAAGVAQRLPEPRLSLRPPRGRELSGGHGRSRPALLAVDYASAGQVFDAVDTLEAEVATRLRAIAEARASARAFAASCLSDHDRHRGQRGELRRRLRLGNGTAAGREVKNPLSLEALRKAQENLVYAHAEGLPALRDARAVRTLAGHMVDLSRQLTVVEIWLDAEAPRE